VFKKRAFVESEKVIRKTYIFALFHSLPLTHESAAGLAAIHKQKLVHRDIKPSNIMVSLEEGGAVTAKIIDLGLAKPAFDAPAEAAISTPGAFAGTREFASPEQFAGVGVDIRSDLYSLGVTLWEMLAGQAPFRGSSAEVMYQHQHVPLPLDLLGVVPQPVDGQSLSSEDQLFILMQAALYLTATRGLSAPDARICYERAEPLCHSLGRPLLQWRLCVRKLTEQDSVVERRNPSRRDPYKDPSIRDRRLRNTDQLQILVAAESFCSHCPHNNFLFFIETMCCLSLWLVLNEAHPLAPRVARSRLPLLLLV
jgi:serine/threonine protein kinase